MDIENKKQNSNVRKEPQSLYLSSNLVDALEEIAFHMRKQIPRNKRKRMSKSILYEIILTNVVENYLAEKQDSLLSTWVINWSKG